MFCHHCGAPMRDDDKFCRSCGAPVQETSEQASQEPQAPQKPYIPSPLPQGTRPVYVSPDARPVNHLQSMLRSPLLVIALIFSGLTLLSVLFCLDHYAFTSALDSVVTLLNVSASFLLTLSLILLLASRSSQKPKAGTGGVGCLQAALIIILIGSVFRSIQAIVTMVRNGSYLGSFLMTYFVIKLALGLPLALITLIFALKNTGIMKCLIDGQPVHINSGLVVLLFLNLLQPLFYVVGASFYSGFGSWFYSWSVTRFLLLYVSYILQTVFIALWLGTGTKKPEA